MKGIIFIIFIACRSLNRWCFDSPPSGEGMETRAEGQAWKCDLQNRTRFKYSVRFKFLSDFQQIYTNWTMLSSTQAGRSSDL
ncbi:hypothetical protein GBF38_015934 [Nibea albiflora]|uniref:Uncharacterized protein n=1 Tax=Nibea albiflora TaxID=240163 RepID=A0ACB7FIC5_NIBAL|nr:hypothetical protein GBF38_015934 [Nibea albiflora]